MLLPLMIWLMLLPGGRWNSHWVNYVICDFLTADKGTCLVIMDKEEYINKSQDLLKEDTYRVIP